MARPRMTIEDRLIDYQTKYRNAIAEIKQKDDEIKQKDAYIEHLTAFVNRLEKDNSEWYEIAKKAQERAIAAQLLASAYRTDLESESTGNHRRKWQSRRPFSSRKG